MVMPRPRVVVVGAGVAGLTAARYLSGSFDVVVVDKGRGVGGRLATRRIGDATFDHGAQFITTHTPEFAEVVAGWERAGVARPWFQGRIGRNGIIDPDGHTRFRGVATMNAIAKHLAEGLDVRVSSRVVALAPSDAGWRMRLDDATDVAADAVVLTAPVPQALALLAAGHVVLSAGDAQALQAIRYEPCLAVLAALDGPSGLGGPGAVSPAEGSIDWMADNSRKGVSTVPAVTIHATAEFSRSHLESSDEIVIEELVRAAELRAKPIEGQAQVQRWRFARPTRVHPERCLVLEGLPPLVCAGDAFGGAKVEGAALSGTAASEAVSSLLGQADPPMRKSASVEDR
ncbi:FAD-dependent oxidoreductase [Acidimicrobiia bacterium EGI L10123]|uniref:NAD(P)/FAD-dependent oxidoreductase n=1 Tax=Salinilacustrithrix flava TaxID=2957203 RepID=UPI003D7C2909|nr:FAD-dependent oxidoreductase [Acidimicrobiia bacterium EGI L10123]